MLAFIGGVIVGLLLGAGIVIGLIMHAWRR